MAPIVCPNQNLPAWKDLAKELGDDIAHLAFQRHVMSGGEGIPTAVVARELLAAKESNDPEAPSRDPSLSYSTVQPHPIPLPEDLYRLARKHYGEGKPLLEWKRESQKGRNDGVFASEALAKLAVDQYFNIRSELSDGPEASFRKMLEYYTGDRSTEVVIDGRMDTALSREALLSAIARYSARDGQLDVDTGKTLPDKPDKTIMYDPALGAEVEVPEATKYIEAAFDDMFDEPVGAELSGGLTEADDDRAMRMVEYQPATRLAAILADDMMASGSRSWASVLETVRNAMARESGSDVLDMSKLGEWLDTPTSKEPLVEFYRRFLKGLAGKRDDGSRDLGPVYNFLAQFSGGYTNRATSMFRADLQGGKVGYRLDEQHDTNPAVNLSRMAPAAARHLSDPANAEALYKILVGGKWDDNGKPRNAIFAENQSGELASNFSNPLYRVEKGLRFIHPLALTQPVFDSANFRIRDMQEKAKAHKAYADKLRAEGKPGLADAHEKMSSVDAIDRSQRRRLVHLLEAVLGPQPQLRNAILNEMTIQSVTSPRTREVINPDTNQKETKTTWDDPFYKVVDPGGGQHGLKHMLFELAGILQKSRKAPGQFENMAADVEKTVRKFLIESRVGKGGADGRTNFELLLGSQARKGTARSPKQGDGSKMAAAGFPGPLEERLRANHELKKHLESLGYNAKELRELERTGRYRDGTPRVMVDGGVRGTEKGGLRDYQKTPKTRDFLDLIDALEGVYADPNQGVHPEYATFWTDQADSGKRLLYNLPRSLVGEKGYDAAWDFAENFVNGSLKNVPAKYRKQFSDAQGTKPLQGVPGGLPAKIKLAVILGKVNPDGTLDTAYNKLLDGTLLQDEGLAAQERVSFGLQDGRMNKTHVIDAINGKTFVKAATQHIVGGSVSPGNILLDLHREIGKKLFPGSDPRGYDSYELTDTGGAKFFEQSGTKDVEIGGETYRVGIAEYDSSFKRRTTQLESPSRPHEISVTAQNITDKISLRGGVQHYLSASRIALAGRALRIASGLKMTNVEKAQLLKSPDSAALAAELAARGYDPQGIPLMADEVAQQRIAQDRNDMSVVVSGFDSVQRASGGAWDGSRLLWHGGKPDLFLTDSYYHDQDGLHVPLVRVNDNDPTGRTGLWLKKGVTLDKFMETVVSHVAAMRANDTETGHRLKLDLLKMVTDTKNSGIVDHRVSFDDLVRKDGTFDKAAIYKTQSEHRPGTSAEDSPYIGGTLYADVSRSPGTTMASHWPARRGEPVAWVKKQSFVQQVGKLESNHLGFKTTDLPMEYWGSGEANESVVHPSLVRAAGTDNDGDKWRFSVYHKDPKTGVAYGFKDEAERGKVDELYQADLSREFRNAKKYGTEETKNQPEFDSARKSYAQQRFSHWKKVLGNELLREGMEVFENEGKKAPGSLINTRMMPDITTTPFGKDGGQKVPHLVGAELAEFNKAVGGKLRTEIDSKLKAAGLEDLQSLVAKTGYVDVPYWLHVQIANGAGEEATAASAARRAAMNQESNRSREVAVANVRLLNQVIRLLDARYKVLAGATLDATGESVFGDLQRGSETATEAERDQSNALVDDFLCSVVNMNIDAMKAKMPETAAAFMTSHWVSLEMPLLATQTFRSKGEVLDFHRKFMKFAQGPIGRAYFETMREADAPIKRDIEAKRDSRTARLEARLVAAKMDPKPFMELYRLSNALRDADAVANAHKRNLGYMDSLSRLGRARDSFDLYRGAREPKVLDVEKDRKEDVPLTLKNKVTTDAVHDRARTVYRDADEHYSGSPMSRRPGQFGAVFDSVLKEKSPRLDTVAAAAHVSANLHGLAALAELPANVRQLIDSGDKSQRNALRLAEAAVYKAYAEQPGNRLLQDLQTSIPGGGMLKRMAGRDQSEALSGAGMRPYWESAKELKGVTLGAKDALVPAGMLPEAGVTLSAKDIQHLLYFYAVTVHGANMRGSQGNFLRMLSPELHAGVGERVNSFVQADRDGNGRPTATPASDKLARVLAAGFAETRGPVLDPEFGKSIVQLPMGFVDHFVGLSKKVAASRLPDGSYQFDGEALNAKFLVKAWTKPRELKDGSRAKALPEGAFTTREQWAQFVALHEYAHGLPHFRNEMEKARSGAKTVGSVEDQVNVYAQQFQRKMSDQIAKDPKYLDAWGKVQDAMGLKAEQPADSNLRIHGTAVRTPEGEGVYAGMGATPHAKLFQELQPGISAEEVDKLRAGPRAGFNVVDRGEDANNPFPTTRFVDDRKEAMKIAKAAGQVKPEFQNETELHSHMLREPGELSYSTVHEYMSNEEKFDRFPLAGNLPDTSTWANVRRIWYQKDSGHDFASGKAVPPGIVKWMEDRAEFHDRNIWGPILSAPDYETAMRRLAAIETWPTIGSPADAARMKSDVKMLMDYNPPKKWSEWRKKQSMHNPWGPQAAYDELMDRFVKLSPAAQKTFFAQYGGVPARAVQDGLWRSLMLGEAQRTSDWTLEQNFHKALAAAEGTAVQGDLFGKQYSTIGHIDPDRGNVIWSEVEGEGQAHGTTFHGLESYAGGMASRARYTKDGRVLWTKFYDESPEAVVMDLEAVRDSLERSGKPVRSNFMLDGRQVLPNGQILPGEYPQHRYSTVTPDPAIAEARLDPKVSREMPDDMPYEPAIVAKQTGTFAIPGSPDEQNKLQQQHEAIARVHEAGATPIAAQPDIRPPKVLAGIAAEKPLSGREEEVVAGMASQRIPDWKMETFVDPHVFMASMLDRRLQLEGTRGLFHQHEMWSAWAAEAVTAARVAQRYMQNLLGTADREGRLSDMIDMERPDVDIEAVSTPGAPLVKDGTTTGQARGRMGGYDPRKAGGKVGQKGQLDENSRRFAYWVDHSVSSWAAGPGHAEIPTSIILPGRDVTPAKAIEAIKKAQGGQNPLPKEVADLMIAELEGGATSRILAASAATGTTAVLVPVDLVEKAFMDSDYRRTLIKHGRNEAELTRESLVKFARDHFDREFERVSRDTPFLLDGEDSFSGYLGKLRNYIPMKHGTGPLAHAVDKIERDLEKTLSQAVDEAVQKNVDRYREQMSPERATVDAGEKYKIPELSGQRLPKTLHETPAWPMEQLHSLWEKERIDLGTFGGRADFIAKVQDGTFEKMGLLPKSAQYADVVRELYNANMRLLMKRKLQAEQLKQPDDGFDPVALARALREQMKGQPGEEPSFGRARAFDTHRQAWEVAGLLPSSYTFSDLVADYGNRQMATLARKITLNNLLLSSDVDGRPLVTALPNLAFADKNSVITDQTWEHAARKWAEYFKVPYDESKTGKENAHRIVSANVTGQSSDRFQDKFNRRYNYTAVKTAYSSVSQWYGQQDRPDEANVMDMMVGGEAAAALKQLMQTNDLWESYRVMSGLQDVNQFMKINALQLSFFHAKALMEDIESATWGKALASSSLRDSRGIFAKDPNHISLGEWFRMLRTNDPYVRELNRIMDKVGITMSYGGVNPADVALGKTEKGIDAMGDWMSKNMGDRWGKDFKSIADSMTGEQSTFIFEELNNVAKLMVTHSLLQKTRAEAFKAGRPYDPVKAMTPYNRYVNEATGGLNPAHYSWATPHARQVMNLGLFSWQWTLGAWNAAGGSLLTGSIIESKTTPEAARFIFQRRLPAMIAMVLIAEPVVAQLGSYLAAAAAGKTTDDDHPWMWQNEEGKKWYADITPLAKMMPWWKGDTENHNKNRRLYARWGKQIHEIMAWFDDPMKTAGGKSSLALQTAWGLATGKSIGSDWNLGFKNEGLAGWVSGRHGFEDSRIAYAGKNLVPGLGSFSVSQMIRNPDAGILGLFGPTSRGTSYHASCQRAMAVLSAWSENDSYRQFQYNQKTQANLHSLLADILDDARANGIPPEEVLNASRASILKVKYAEMFAATHEGKVDQHEIERVAREIMRLNGTVQSVRQSERNRAKLYGEPAGLSPEMNKALQEAFHEPEAQARREEAKAHKPKKPKPADQFAGLRELAEQAKKER